MLQAKLSVYKKNLGVGKPKEQVGAPAGFGGAPTKPAASTPAISPSATERAKTLLAGSPQPFNAPYDSKVNAITTGLNDTLSGSLFDEGRTAQRYGWDTTSYTDLEGKPLAADPFSQAKLLQRAYEQRQRGDTNSYAAQGQLYSGAMGRQRANTTFDAQQREHESRMAWEDAKRAFTQRRIDAGSDAAVDTADAEWDRVQGNLNVPLDPALVPTAFEQKAMAEANGDEGMLASILTNRDANKAAKAKAKKAAARAKAKAKKGKKK